MKDDPPVAFVCPKCGRAFVGTAGWRIRGGSVTARSRARTALHRHLQDVHGIWNREASLLCDASEAA